MGFDPKVIEELLYEGEGSRLDFKRKHYAILNNAPKDGNAAKAKGDFLKDIVAFSNSADVGHILIGVDPNQRDANNRAKVMGDPLPNLDEADIQSLVNDNTNAPVTFEYDTVKVDGGTIAVFRIPKQGQMIFLKKDVGEARGDTCYRRQGSRTVTISPAELVEWGRNEAVAAKRPFARIELGSQRDQTSTVDASVISTILRKPPKPTPEQQAEIDALRKKLAESMSPASAHIPALQYHASVLKALEVGRQDLTFSEHRTADEESVVKYVTQQALLKRLQIRIENVGQNTLEHAKLTLTFETFPGLQVLESDELIRRPRGLFDALNAISPVFDVDPRPALSVASVPGSWNITVAVGRIVPSDHVWSQPFWIGSSESVNVPIRARLVADGLAPPIEQDLSITIDMAGAWLTRAVQDFREEEKKR